MKGGKNRENRKRENNEEEESTKIRTWKDGKIDKMGRGKIRRNRGKVRK